MKTIKTLSYNLCITVVMLLSFSLTNYKNENSHKTPSDNGRIKLPTGFGALVVTDSLGEGNHVAMNSYGDIYVSLKNIKNGAGVVGLRDINKDGVADVIKYFVGADTIVIRYKLVEVEGELEPDLNNEVIAKGFEPQNQHETKSIAFDNAGNLYVTLGMYIVDDVKGKLWKVFYSK